MGLSWSYRVIKHPPMNKANIFPLIPQHLPEEAFETILSNGTIKIERIISKGHASPDGFWYDQEFSEWVLLLRGKASLAFDNAGNRSGAGRLPEYSSPCPSPGSMDSS